MTERGPRGLRERERGCEKQKQVIEWPLKKRKARSTKDNENEREGKMRIILYKRLMVGKRVK